MTQSFANGDTAFALLAASTAWLAAGGVVGAFHFMTLQTSARMLATGSSLPAALALHLVRFAITAGALFFIARHGGLSLVVATLGILAARAVVLRPASRQNDFDSPPAPP